MSGLCSENEFNLLKGAELEWQFVKDLLWLGLGFYATAFKTRDLHN